MARTRTAPNVESRPVAGHPSQPLVGLFLDPDSDELTYFASEEDAEAAVPNSAVDATLNSAGMWSDHDWDEMEAALDRIRHESAPSRPFEE